ncbi:hypothetical protein INS49_005558 [Diaporthe citri]|uniref:uncharacterized protein n=1 Tax=Diaporthe citri TaxID=83186 RepID=UPI001C7ED599|nr:uncharacterized protein INS49_005558 [Diaporthe citri]KAG6353596.1 hypothetical protein INS49_005558 [Diaporthe citri]
MVARFRPLGVQMYGKQRTTPDYFFEEGPQSEEGKEFESLVWGETLSLGPLARNPQGGSYLHPYVLAISWPWSHKYPFLQHPGVDRSEYAPYASGGYEGYLLNPPAPVYEQWRPVEVEYYERFLQEAWWQGQFQRFGHQALRLNPPFNALMVLPDDYEFFRDEATTGLYELRQFPLAQWLWHGTEGLVIGNLTAARLKFEARTWGRTYAKIDTQVDKCLADIGDLGNALEGWLGDSMAGRLTADAQATITAAFDRAATTIVSDDLMVVERLFRYSIQYAQALIAMYSLLPTEKERRTVHRRYMTPLRNHLNSVRNKLGTLTQRLDVFAAAAARVDGQNPLAALLQGFRGYIVEFLQVARVVNAGLEHVIGLLADEFIAPGLDYARHPETLPAVPEARKRLTMSASLKKAALRKVQNLRGDARDRVRYYVSRWTEIVMRKQTEQRNAAAKVDAATEVDAAAMEVDP